MCHTQQFTKNDWKTSILKPIYSVFEGSRITCDIKRNLETLLTSFDETTSGCVVFEDISLKALKECMHKLRPLIDGNLVKMDRKWEKPKECRWPDGVFMTTNCTKEEIDENEAA